MEAQLETKFVKLSLEDQKLKAEGQGFAVSADVGAVQDAIQSTVAAVGIKNCAIFAAAGAGAAALFVVGKALANKWPWLGSPSIEKDNTLKIEIPSDRENAFKKLMKGKLQQEVKDCLEDAETNLEGILGQEAYEENGKKILELIENIRVSKVEEVGGETESMAAAVKYEDCIIEREETDCTNIVVDTSNKGGKIAAVAAKRSKFTGNVKGGVNLAMKANNAEDVQGVVETVKGGKIKVVIWSDLFEEDFKAEFDGSEVIRNVRKALEKARPDPGKYTIVRGDGVIMDEDENTETVGHADRLSSARNWKAIARK